MYIESGVSVSSPYYPTIKELVGPGSLMACAPSKNILAMCQGDDSYRVFAGLCVPVDFAKTTLDLADGAATRQLLVSQFFEDWDPSLKDILLRADGTLREWSLHYLPPEHLPWKPVPGVTLIGDAAHVTTPFVGEGVNCAMTDALRLAEEIAKHGVDEQSELDAAVAAYEEDMLPRGVDLIQRSLASGEIFYGEDSPQSVIDVIRGGDVIGEAAQANADG